MVHSTTHKRSCASIVAGVIIGLLTIALSAIMVLHQRIPDVMGLGLVVDNISPWLVTLVIPLALMALVVRSRTALTLLVLPVMAWAWMFAIAFVPQPERPTPKAPMTVVTQNVREDANTATASALALAKRGDIITLQELDEAQQAEVTKVLSKTHPYSASAGTVGVWSRYPMGEPQALDLGLGWKRALRIDMQVPGAPTRLYAIHAASARPLEHVHRDEMLDNLARIIEEDPSDRIVAAGDFNATSTDRAMNRLLDVVNEPAYSDWGFGFTWPRSPLPMLRIDHTLFRGFDPIESTTVEAGESDHLAVVTTVDPRL